MIVQNPPKSNNKVELRELYSHKKNLEFETFSDQNYKYNQKRFIVSALDDIDYEKAFGKYFVSDQGLTLPDLKKDLEKLRNCSNNEIIQYNPEDMSEYKKVFSNSCGLPYCPICAKKRRSKLMAETFPVIKQLEKNPKLTWYMVTISEQNTKDLRLAFSSLRNAWERFLKKGQSGRSGEASKIAGYILNMEYTQSGKYYNVHAHIMVCSNEDEELNFRVYDNGWSVVDGEKVYNKLNDWRLEKKKYAPEKVPKDVLKGYALHLKKKSNCDSCITCMFQCDSKDERKENYLCDNLVVKSKLSMEWEESTLMMGTNIDVKVLKDSGVIKRKDGSLKKITCYGDNLSEILKYVTKIGGAKPLSLVRNYVTLKGLKIMSRGGLFTNYKHGKQKLFDFTQHLRPEEKAVIESANRVEPHEKEEHALMQVIRQGEQDSVIIPHHVSYESFVQGQKREREMYSLQAKAIAKTQALIKKEFSIYRYNIDNYCGWHVVGNELVMIEGERIPFAKIYIEKKQVFKKTLSEYIQYLMSKYRKFVFHSSGDYVDPGFDPGDFEYIAKPALSLSDWLVETKTDFEKYVY